MEKNLFVRLKECRIKLGLSQSEAASMTGFEQKDISRWESAKAKFIPIVYIQFLYKRGVDLNWLYTGEEYWERNVQKDLKNYLLNPDKDSDKYDPMMARGEFSDYLSTIERLNEFVTGGEKQGIPGLLQEVGRLTTENESLKTENQALIKALEAVGRGQRSSAEKKNQ